MFSSACAAAGALVHIFAKCACVRARRDLASPAGVRRWAGAEGGGL